MAAPNPSATKIDENLYLGDSKSSRQRELLEEHKIIAVVSLSVGRWVQWNQPWYKIIVPDDSHLFIPCKDNMTQDLLPSLATICNFIDHHVQLGSVLVHCDQGVSRSPTVMVAYLMRSRRLTFEEASALVSTKRKIKPNDNFKEQLRVWEAVQYNIWADSEGEIPTPKAEYAAYLSRRAERLQDAGLTGDEQIGISSL
jgi:protein-tyrosine phosphatase